MNIKNLPIILRIDIEYYDETERNKLDKYASADRIKKVAGNTIDVPTIDFLTYYIFYKKTPGKPGYSNFEELSEKFERALSELDGYFNFEGGTLRTNDGENFRDNAVAERIGEAIGLSVVNEIHGLSRADWNKIDEIRGFVSKKTFDYEFEIGSDGENIIHVENKGSLVQNNSHKNSSVSNHKANIVSKKFKIREDNQYPYPSNLMYGTIGSVDSSGTRNTRCWLLDPEPNEVDIEPNKLRLLNRYSYYLSLIRMLSPRSQLTAALSTRFYDLVAIREFKDLDGLAVRKSNGEKFPLYDGDYNESPLHAGNKSRLINGDSIGQVVAHGDGQLVYLGIDMLAINMMVEQNFEKIINYSKDARIFNDHIRCSFGASQQRLLKVQLENYFGFDQAGTISKSNYENLNLGAEIIAFREGLLFGFLARQSSLGNERV